jgi:hypothetical protein
MLLYEKKVYQIEALITDKAGNDVATATVIINVMNDYTYNEFDSDFEIKDIKFDIEVYDKDLVNDLISDSLWEADVDLEADNIDLEIDLVR